MKIQAALRLISPYIDVKCLVLDTLDSIFNRLTIKLSRVKYYTLRIQTDLANSKSLPHVAECVMYW